MNHLFLQASGGGGFMEVLMGSWPILLMFVVIYFFFLRPQANRQKAQDAFMNDLQKGDEVATASGILGKINKIEGKIVTLQVDTKTFIRVTKTAISKEMTESIQENEANKEN
jgi:preprotein translocase subunit YajC